MSLHKDGSKYHAQAMGCRLPVLAAAMSVLAAVSAPAGADFVDISGSFTSFYGPVGYPPGTPEFAGFGPSYFNGIAVTPDTPSSRPGAGLLNYTFSPGTSSVEFYNEGEGPNLISFTPATNQNAVVGAEILIGTFTLQNGSWFGGLGEGDALFSFQASTSTGGHTFSDVIRLKVTQFGVGNTPEQNADYFYFDGNPQLGTMRVYETLDSPTGSNIGSIDLYGRIGSLVPTRFANAQGGVFIGPAAIPEPETYAMMLAGLGLIALSVRRRKHNRG